MTRIVEPDKAVEGMEKEQRLDRSDGSIWEAIDDIMRRVPEEVLNRLPTDGAEQHDHYLYDSPKKASCPS